MAVTHHVFLIPGFFGFSNLGEFRYFGHVHDVLSACFAESDDEAEIHPNIAAVATSPTASLRTRASRLLAAIEATAGGDDGPIHLIGHSTGGLDARLLVSPGIVLGNGLDPEPIARRVRSVVTVASPNRGSPLAAFFAGLLGQRLLQLMTLATVYVLRFGHVPLSFMLRLAALLTRVEIGGFRDNLIDQLFEQLLADFTPERRREVQLFLHEVTVDQALLVQLTPDAMDVFDAAVHDRPGVAYGSVVTRSPAPSLRERTRLGFNVHTQAAYGVYEIIHRRTSVFHNVAVPPEPAALAELERQYGELPTLADNDGIVPTLSQPWGRVLAAVTADHLDVIGHFDGQRETPAHRDWMTSGAHFRRPELDQVWRRVARFLLQPS